MNFSKMEAQRNKRLSDIVDVLEKSEMGSEDHDSTQEPFFGIGETRAFSQDHTLIQQSRLGYGLLKKLNMFRH